MSDRFSPVALMVNAWGSLRVRSAVGHERPDWTAIVALAGLPAGLGVLSFWQGWVFRETGSLVAAFALLSAAQVAIVPQFASWRQRLSERARASEGIARRKVDEAVSNLLLSVVVCVLLTVLAVVLANIAPPSGPDDPLALTARLLTGVMCAGACYLVLTILLIVNLLFDAYQDANGLAATPESSARHYDDEAA